MTRVLIGYAAYLPRYRLAGADIGLRRGDRVVASFDEDSTTMATAAAAAAIDGYRLPRDLYFATSSPGYADKTNATAIHAALGLGREAFATDMCGTGRSGFAAWRAAASTGGVAVAADVRVGRPGSPDEKFGGDGAAALLFGEGPGIAEILGTTSLTSEFLDRWRSPTSVTGQQWEERFGAHCYGQLIEAAVQQTLDKADTNGVDHVVLTCPNAAVLKRAATLIKGQKSTVTSPIGFAGAADASIAVCAVLDTADAGETILVVSAVDGCDTLLLRTTERLPNARQPRPISEQRDSGLAVSHLTYLSWRGLVELEPPRRPEPDRPAAPPSFRSETWKFGLTGSRCQQCGFTHLPPAVVCRGCGAIDRTEAAPVARLGGAIATYTVDHLAYSPSPPVVQAVIDVDGGGRCTLEIADAEPDQLAVGSRVEFTFRRLFTAGAVHNYFWKARLVDPSGSEKR
ncbi:MAG TPA: OB-fold domain-containing protein [Mycobacterium sp.]|uniref:OB-fold domain-containing protein n=1 Tax=Mycobacterium sp. TaxID=1785 RepID=UPI002C9497D7|nr:OB-fold domain-containing protein [Mycobacterium sp.]HME79517.1 OB-fold domain-containing protein [Mycobacterium sp.]